MTDWFTSDTHWWHTNIIHYSKRPWTKLDGQPDVGAMNEALIERWNARVAPGDHVWHLGDLVFGGFPKLAAIRPRLNGTITLVLGNHDDFTKTQYRKLDIEPCSSRRLWTKQGMLLLVHDPKHADDKMKGVDTVLCGHVHELWRERMQKERRVINVGVDVRDYAPRTLGELLRGEPYAIRLLELGPLQPVSRA